MHADLNQHARAVRGHVLVNGQYATFLTVTGAGYSAWREFALTRWNADPVVMGEGFFLYARDLASGAFWSLTGQPAGAEEGSYQTRFAADRAQWLHRQHGIESLLDVCIATDADMELRRVTLRNLGQATRRIELTSYAEVVLQQWAADAAHPAFSKLFIQTEWVAATQTLLAHRRPRAAAEFSPWLAHALCTTDPGVVAYETDRERFIGRGYSLAEPRSLLENAPLSGTVGNVLDPIVSLRHSIELSAGATAEVTFMLGAAAERDSLLATVQRYRQASQIAATFAALSTIEALDWQTHSSLVRPQFATAPSPAHHDVGDLADVNSEASSDETLQFWNGYGGFNADASEYVIRVTPNAQGCLQLPPQPWVNIIANPQFGFMVSESGAGFTWSQNSRENRLTPWHNDPLLDTSGEALYLRDEDSGLYWSLFPGPLYEAGTYEIRHGFGYSHLRRIAHGLEHQVWVFVPPDAPVKITLIRLRNLDSAPRRLSLFSYAQLVLGVLPNDHAASLAIEQDGATGALLAENCNRVFSGRIAFAAATPTDSVPMYISGDRKTFLGVGGDLARPAALLNGKSLDGRLGTGLDPCFALQVTLHLEANSEVERAFLLGEASSRDGARRLISHYRQAGAPHAALHEAQNFWRTQLGAVQLQSPAPMLDVLVNGWAAYQTLSCRLWARSAFYQSGGAFGFRDQLQDALALIYHDPALAREQLLLNAAHQFVEGDVLHWWHPPLGCGIRTRFSDDRLWLPYLAAFYGRSTGDWELFSQQIPFLTAPAVPDGEDEVFLTAQASGESASFYEHCCRALDCSLTQGAHGLPLMGTGDWNDGMNRVGREGRGESVWLGFFLYTILGDFIPVCGQQGDYNRARRYAAFRTHLAEALNEHGWDGAWYRRAWYDDGAVLGSASSDECQIDALAQAWAVISKAAPNARAEAAMDAVDKQLIDRQAGLIRLFTPPFINTAHDPGYIKGYVAGVRENGGQYTHAALWVVEAFAQLGRRDQVAALLEMLSPIQHTATAQAVATYRLEPYWIAADIYSALPHIGRGGWSAYTGSAGWLLRVTLESLLGLELVEGHALRLRPCIPDSWPSVKLRYRLADQGTRYDIEVLNPHAQAQRIVSVEIDERRGRIERGAACIPLFRDGLVHQVQVTLGATTGNAEDGSV